MRANAREDSDPRTFGRGQHFVERLQAERIQDDLDVGDPRMRDGGERLRARLDGDAVCSHPPLGDERIERLIGRVVFDHLRGRAVQLHEVERVGAKVLARTVHPGAERFRRVVLRLLCDTASHFRRDRDLALVPLSQELADQALAAPVSIHVGGVEEVDSPVDGSGQHRAGVVFRDDAPIGAELPGAESDG